MGKYSIDQTTLQAVAQAIRDMRQHSDQITPEDMPEEIRAIIHPAPDRIEKENEVIPESCTEEGSYDLVTYCGTCGLEKSRETIITEPGEHTPGKQTRENYIPATCTEAGGYDMVTRCTKCGNIVSTRHWTIARTAHVAGDSGRENEIPATCTSEGSYDFVIYCKNCGNAIQRSHRTTPKLDHTPGDPVQEGDEMVTYCTVCGEEISRTPA